MDFREDQIHRYARHIIMPEVGGGGQAKLLAARVLVIGAGGLGSPLVMYLAAAGIGTIGIVDDDTVSLSNLQRQVLYETGDIGRAKVMAAGARLAALNPEIAIDPLCESLTDANARDLVRGLGHHRIMSEYVGMARNFFQSYRGADLDAVCIGTDRAQLRNLVHLDQHRG